MKYFTLSFLVLFVMGLKSKKKNKKMPLKNFISQFLISELDEFIKTHKYVFVLINNEKFKKGRKLRNKIKKIARKMLKQ